MRDKSKTAANDSRAMEGTFSVPMDGKKRKLSFNEMTARGKAIMAANAAAKGGAK